MKQPSTRVFRSDFDEKLKHPEKFQDSSLLSAVTMYPR